MPPRSGTSWALLHVREGQASGYFALIVPAFVTLPAHPSCQTANLLGMSSSKPIAPMRELVPDAAVRPLQVISLHRGPGDWFEEEPRPDQSCLRLCDFVGSFIVDADMVLSLSPYKAMIEAMRQFYERLEQEDLQDMPMSLTIDSIQGQEGTMCTAETVGPGFTSDEHYLDLMPSRHKSALVIVGDINDVDGEGNFVNRLGEDGRISPLEFFKGSGWPVYRLRTQLRMAEGQFELCRTTVYSGSDVPYTYGPGSQVSLEAHSIGLTRSRLPSASYANSSSPSRWTPPRPFFSRLIKQ
ncbi:hypothetical protein NM208_g10940 [Fusarium decemcellulare]|uniref:Uncharacterized protein n=1 Tax=Fusarium decemcellulare TaxID=57161 RepID=A0ACC1RW38_9HYPO|nr:hypothetical protein NM208_g10940 [Fusarium decemcellulare]